MKDAIKAEKQLLAITKKQGFKGDDLRSNPLLMRCMIALWEAKENELERKLGTNEKKDQKITICITQGMLNKIEKRCEASGGQSVSSWIRGTLARFLNYDVSQ